MRYLSNIIFWFINCALWVALFILAFLFIVLLVQVFSNSVVILNINEINVQLTNSYILKIIYILVSFLVAVITLKKTIDIQTVNSLAKLRELLNTKEKKEIHNKLINNPHDDFEIEIEELDYIGTIELGAIMHRKGIISNRELYNQFGYRVENIVNSSLYKKISEDSKYYEDFIYIKKIIEKYSIKNKISSKVIH